MFLVHVAKSGSLSCPIDVADLHWELVLLLSSMSAQADVAGQKYRQKAQMLFLLLCFKNGVEESH